MRKLTLALAAVLLTTAGAAVADGVSDATAAQAAFDKGDFRTAISLYTRAIQDKALGAEDRASILFSRGMARLKMGQRTLAASDFEATLKLVPGDPYAMQELNQLRGRSVVAAAPRAPSVDFSRWGPFATLAGRDWLGTSAQPILYLHFEWSVPNAVLVYSGQDARGKALTGQVTIDATTGKLLEQANAGGKTSITYYNVEPDRLTSEGGKGTQQIISRDPSGYLQIVTQKRSGADWKTTQVIVLSPTTPTFLASLGWPAPGSVQHVSFLKELGQSLKGGALAGLHDGVQDGVHDAAQDRIRRVTHTRVAPTQTVRTVQSQ